jgi:hypothetical protein
VVTGFPSTLTRFSREANVIVRTPPVITRQPVAINGLTQDTVCSGMLFQFGVLAEGTDLTYRWFRNGAPIPLAEYPTFSSREPGVYFVEVTGVCGLVTRSQSVTMSNIVQPEVGLQPPYELRLKEGASLDLSITVASGSQPLNAQWAVDGQDIMGATGLTLRIPAVKLSDAGRYVCVLSNECGIDVSNVCVVTVDKVNPTSVDEEIASKVMRIVPTPMTETATIQVRDLAQGPATVSILDLTGKLISSVDVTIPASGSHSLSVTREMLPSAGTYVVRLRTAAGEISRLLICAP